jgi:hypothetical protein
VLFGFPALLPIPKRKKFTTNGPQPILRNQELAPNYNRFNGGGLPSKTNIILRWEFRNPSQEDRRSCATSKTFNTKSSNNTKRNKKDPQHQHQQQQQQRTHSKTQAFSNAKKALEETRKPPQKKLIQKPRKIK